MDETTAASTPTPILVAGPDLEMEITDDPRRLADILREHGPELLQFMIQTGKGRLALLSQETQLAGADDHYKYYVTTLTGAHSIVGDGYRIDWDV